MGISITKSNSVMTTIEVPLMGGYDPDIKDWDKDWNDNTWLVEHLRQLADMIESGQPRIINIGIKTGCNYNIPNLVLDVFTKRNEILKK